MMSRTNSAVALFLAVYGLLVVPWIFWPTDDAAFAVLVFGLYSLLAVGLATDLTENVLALCWPACVPPRLKTCARKAPVAVLMTVCDDSSPEHLSYLRPLAVAGYDVYLLDDSIMPVTLPEDLAGRVAHVRRGNHRAGAKAGNLNHWLNIYGARYEYAALLDADSEMSVKALETLVLTAEHPANARTAVFQAKIESARSRSLFAQLLSAGARPRARVMERVHAPLGILLSFGHNQLLRVEPIREVGGFNERLTSEDTSLSLQLAAAGWQTQLVDVWTRDTDPETVAAYVRRTTRWARQTIELFHHPWRDVPLRLKLLLCRHLLSYTLPVVGVLLLGISLWTGPETPERAWSFLRASLSLTDGYQVYGLTLWPVFIVFLLYTVLRLVLARAEGVSWRLLLLSFILGNAPFAALLPPLIGSLLISACGVKVRFVPTNSRYALSRDASLRRHLLFGLTTALLLSALVAGALYHPGSLLVGFNIIWLTQLLLSPLSLLILSLGKRRGAGRSLSDSEAVT